MSQESKNNWSHMVGSKSDWHWKGDRLVQDGVSLQSPTPPRPKKNIHSLVVKYIYGRQNLAKPVRDIIRSAISRLPDDQFGLNFGAGNSEAQRNLLTMDVAQHEGIDIVSSGTLDIPLVSDSISLVICQEVLEHVHAPNRALEEFHRILRNDGELVLQLPFIIGYHPGPTDFWRFSREAYEVLLPKDLWTIECLRISVGHGTGLYRILTEFVAIHFSIFGGRVYRLAKGFLSLVLSPIMLFDYLTDFLPEKDRIAGGYIVVARARKSQV